MREQKKRTDWMHSAACEVAGEPAMSGLPRQFSNSDTLYVGLHGHNGGGLA